MAEVKNLKLLTGSSYKDNTKKWTGEEMQLLQQVVIDYKAAKTNEGLDWKVIRSKYEEIAEGIARPSI